MQSEGDTRHRGHIVFACALSLAVTMAYRFSPALPAPFRRAHCRVVVADLAGLVDDVDCDSPSFLQLAADPGRLLAPSRWQSRPLYVLSGTVLGAPFGSFAGRDALRLRAAYIGFVLFNVLALAVAVALFEALLAGTCGTFVARTLALVLLTNDVVKVYVWSPHLQMLNVLQPLLLTWVVLHVATRPSLGRVRALGYAALAGVAPLFYGSGFLLLPGLVLGFLSRPEARRRDAWARSAATAAAMAVVFVVPVTAWARFLVARTGFFSSLEVSGYRQFVWAADRFAAHGLVAVAGDLATALGVFAEKLLLVGWFPLLLSCFAAVLAASDREATRATLRRAHRLLAATLCSLVLNVVFFVALGYYTERLSLNAVPPLLLVTGVLLAGPLRRMTAPRRRALHAALLCVVLGWTAWQVRRPGPWSFHTSAWRAGSEGLHPVAVGRLPGSPPSVVPPSR